MKSLYANGTKAWCLPLKLDHEPQPLPCVIRGFSGTQILVEHPDFDAAVNVDEDCVLFGFDKAESAVGLRVMLSATRMLDRQQASNEPGTAVWVLPEVGAQSSAPVLAELLEHEHIDVLVQHDISSSSIRVPADRVFFVEAYAIDAANYRRRLALILDEDRANAGLAQEHDSIEVGP